MGERTRQHDQDTWYASAAARTHAGLETPVKQWRILNMDRHQRHSNFKRSWKQPSKHSQTSAATSNNVQGQDGCAMGHLQPRYVPTAGRKSQTGSPHQPMLNDGGGRCLNALICNAGEYMAGAKKDALTMPDRSLPHLRHPTWYAG